MHYAIKAATTTSDVKMKRRQTFPQHQALALAITQALLCTSATAATITVDSLADNGVGCTLREAIAAANSDAAGGGCAAGSGVDRVVFDPAILPGTVTLNGSEIAITSSLTISGPGRDQLTVSGGSQSRIFFIDDATTNTSSVTVEAITLRNGRAGYYNASGMYFVYGAGGALRNHEELTIRNSLIAGNGSYGRGGALLSSGPLHIETTSFQSNNAFRGDAGFSGGAIYSRGDLSIIDSTFTNNQSSAAGGAIVASGESATVANSTFNDNTASNSDGAVSGGAIAFYGDGSFSLDNSTVSDNSLSSTIREYGGGVAVSNGTLTIRNTTISGNSGDHGGGIFARDSATVHVQDSIIANSLGNDDCVGTLATNDNNLIEDRSCSPALFGDPLLAPLENNGGPTQTHALLPSSGAIDADNASCVATDQRGLSRDDGTGFCDIGAFESDAPIPAMVVTTLSDEVDPADGLCALREAVTGANENRPMSFFDGECAGGFGDDTIVFDPALNPGTIVLDGSQLLITDPVTIQGPADRGIDISGDDSSRIFRLNQSTVTLDRLTLRDGNAVPGNLSGYGGAIASLSADLTLSNSYLTNNAAQVGGAIYAGRGLIIRNTTIANNFAEFTGGGIRARGATMQIENSTLYNNYAEDAGGGISSYGADVELNHITLAGNGAANSGDAISQTTGGTMTVTNTILVGPGSSTMCTLEDPLTLSVGNWVEDGGCSAAFSGDPLLGSLQDNGGLTPTMALLAGSNAVDNGAAAYCQTDDQRGFQRDSSCDIGAFEFAAQPPPDEIFSDGFE